MGEQIKTALDATLIVAEALGMYREGNPRLREEVEEIQSVVSVPRIRIKLKSGETFVIDITREPRPNRQ